MSPLQQKPLVLGSSSKWRAGILREAGVPFIELIDYPVDRTAIALVSAATCRRYEVMPIALAPGRIVAGFGVGGSRIFSPMGFSPGRPFSALVECVETVDALWRGQPVAHGASLPWSPGPLPIAIASERKEPSGPHSGSGTRRRGYGQRAGRDDHLRHR